MRHAILAVGLVLLPVLANAQNTSSTSSYQGEQFQYGWKRVQFADAAKESQNANANLWKAVDNYQRNWTAVKDERELWLARNQIYDNVISLRSKDNLQQYLDEQRDRLGVGDRQGYERIGEYNPYDGRSYIRYYDKDTGQLKISEVRGLREDLERQRQDIEKHRERLARSAQDVEDKYSTAIDAYNKADTARRAFNKAATDLAAARARSQQQSTSNELRSRLRQVSAALEEVNSWRPAYDNDIFGTGELTGWYDRTGRKHSAWERLNYISSLRQQYDRIQSQIRASGGQ